MRCLSLNEALAFAASACRRAGASEPAAASLAHATVAAEARGMSAVGFAHLPDYLAGFRAGRIRGGAEPEITTPLGAVIQVDARGGIAQLGFDRLCRRAERLGVALFVQRNSFTAGELGYYVERLARRGLVGFAATNGPALLSPAGVASPVYCTNPIAFAAPVAGGPPLLIDQASSATAYVTLRDAARRGEPIPEGWAVDEAGAPTTDPAAALRGHLVAFGGARGGNLALMVEVLAAGLPGAGWSLDNPDFAKGREPLDAGLTVVAIAPAALDPEFSPRLARQIDRLSAANVHIPGRAKAELADRAATLGLMIADDLVEAIEQAG